MRPEPEKKTSGRGPLDHAYIIRDILHPDLPEPDVPFIVVGLVMQKSTGSSGKNSDLMLDL